MRDHHVPRSLCVCGKPLDGAMEATYREGAPVPGDCTICIFCERVLIFEADFSLRPITKDELAEMEPDNRSELMSIMKAVRQAKAARGLP